MSTITFRTHQGLDLAREQEIARSSRELATSRRWWCGAPCVWSYGTPRRMHGTLDLTFDWDRDVDPAMAAHDLGILIAWMRGIATSWDIEIPGEGTAVIGPNVPAPLAAPLEALERRLAAHGAITDAASLLDAHADRYGDITLPAVWTSRGLGERAEYTHAILRQVLLSPHAESQALVADAAEIGQTGCAGAWQWASDTQVPWRIADRMALELGLAPLGAAWAPLSAEDALGLLARAIHLDLAYGMKRTDEREARALATAWLACAGAGAHILTNGHWSTDFSGTSNPIGTATFDVAFAVVGPDRGALVWIGDED